MLQLKENIYLYLYGNNYILLWIYKYEWTITRGQHTPLCINCLVVDTLAWAMNKHARLSRPRTRYGFLCSYILAVIPPSNRWHALEYAGRVDLLFMVIYSWYHLYDYVSSLHTYFNVTITMLTIFVLTIQNMFYFLYSVDYKQIFLISRKLSWTIWNMYSPVFHHASC